MPQTEKQMLNPKPLAVTEPSEWRLPYMQYVLCRPTVTQDRPAGFITKSRDEVQWLPLNSMAV